MNRADAAGPLVFASISAQRRSIAKLSSGEEKDASGWTDECANLSHRGGIQKSLVLHDPVRPQDTRSRMYSVPRFTLAHASATAGHGASKSAQRRSRAKRSATRPTNYRAVRSTYVPTGWCTLLTGSYHEGGHTSDCPPLLVRSRCGTTATATRTSEMMHGRARPKNAILYHERDLLYHKRDLLLTRVQA